MFFYLDVENLDLLNWPDLVLLEKKIQDATQVAIYFFSDAS